MTREYSRGLPNKAATSTKSNSQFFKYEPPPKPHTYIYPLKKTPCHSDTILRNDNRIKRRPRLTPGCWGKFCGPVGLSFSTPISKTTRFLKHTPFFTSMWMSSTNLSELHLCCQPVLPLGYNQFCKFAVFYLGFILSEQPWRPLEFYWQF